MLITHLLLLISKIKIRKQRNNEKGSEGKVERKERREGMSREGKGYSGMCLPLVLLKIYTTSPIKVPFVLGSLCFHTCYVL